MLQRPSLGTLPAFPRWATQPCSPALCWGRSLPLSNLAFYSFCFPESGSLAGPYLTHSHPVVIF